MGSFSFFHLLIILLIIGGPILGIIRGVKNSSFLYSLLSVIIPIYGIFYFFVGKRT